MKNEDLVFTIKVDNKASIEKLKKELIEAFDNKTKKFQWRRLPKGWTLTSLLSFWGSIGGTPKKCMRKMKGHVVDEELFCYTLEDEIIERLTTH